MAADSSGVEWATIVKPILAASYGSFNKNDVTDLVKAIVKSEADLLNHGEQYETFYTSFAALAADYISSSTSSVCKGQLGSVCAAARILLQYLLSRLQSDTSPDSVSPNTLTTKQLLLPIKALCSATSMLCRADQIALTAIMKNAKLPPHIKTAVPGDKENSSPKETKSKSRTDLSAMIAEQLMTPLHDFVPQKVLPSEPVEVKPSTETTTTETHQDTELLFVQKSVASLQSLNAGDALIDLCLNLPHLLRYRHKYIAAVSKKTFSLPSTHTEALLVRHSLQPLVNDINMVWTALSLPVLEPLTPVKMENLSSITMSCLYAAVSIATANSILGISSAVSPKTANTNSSGSLPVKPGEEEGNLDALAVSVVEKSLEIFNLVSNVFKTSTRAGGHNLQNHLLLGVWLLVCGLQNQLSTSSLLPSDKSGKEDKGKSPSKSRDSSSRINLIKVQQGFGVLSVALACRALTMMSALLDDLLVEAGEVTEGEEPTLAPLHILTPASALERAARVLTAVPLNQFLFYLATISYRKACTLKRIQKHPPEGDTFSTSDSTTYYDDDIMSCSEESSPDDDDDSEPLLGLWFEETISVPDANLTAQTGSETQDSTNKTNATPDTSGSIVPEKGEPNGYISLASQIFQFMNKYLLNSESAYILQYVKTGLAEQQMVILAAIIRDLDRETARTETGTISVYFGAALGVLYSEFSQALTRYSHNLLARGLLVDSLQVSLLQHLGVTADNNNAWPLQVYPRTLAVLAQVLLLKPAAEKESSIINIWNRLIHTLVENICNYSTTFDADNEDLNVEHAQLLLFLFHSLNLMQKKSVLLACASGIIRVGESSIRGLMKETQLLCLSRLLLVFEYMMKYLYDAPPVLLQQVQWNLFNATSMVGETVQGRAPARIFCPWKEIEDNYRKLGPQDEFSMKPRFYSIINTELNNQEHPKLDGLACNFVLGTAEKVKYPLLMDVLIEILNISDQTIPSIKSTEKISFTALCATQYCFSICWRLLLQLPPSTPYLDKLALGQGVPATPLLLHSLVWAPRAGHKFFNNWMKDALVKQGMYTQYAENLLKSVIDMVNSCRYDITLAKNCIIALMPHIQTEGWLVPKRDLPTVMDLCLMDTVIAKVQALTEDTPIQPITTDSSDFSKTPEITEPGSPRNDLAQDLLPHVLRLTEVILACSRTSLMYQINDSSEASGGYSLSDFIAFRCVLAVSSSRSVKTQALSSALTVLLPNSVRTVLDKWNANGVADFPSNTYANDIIPGESYVLAVVNSHISSLSSQQTFTINPSLKHLLYSLTTFISDHIMKCEETSPLRQQAVSVLAPLTLDACTEYLHDCSLRTLERALGDAETDAHQICIYNLVLNNIYTLIINYTDATSVCSKAVDERLLQECLGWMEGLLDKPAGRQALEQFFDASTKHDLLQILLSISSSRTCKSEVYSTKVLQFFNKLFNAAEKNPGDNALEKLRASILNLATVETNQLRNWLRHVGLGGATKLEPIISVVEPPLTLAETEPFTPTSTSAPAEIPVLPVKLQSFVTNKQAANKLVQENQLLLQYLTLYIISDTSQVNVAKEEVAVTLLEALIPIGSQLLSTAAEGVGFKELMVVMATLADAGSGRGHLQLFTAAMQWLDICKQHLCRKEVVSELETSGGSGGSMVEATCYVVNYTSDVITALCPSVGGRASSPPWDGEALPLSDLDTDWMDDLGHDDDEESGGDDSDEDSLCNKLCTFTITQKEFMNQHWYHCHTCKMVDGVGVCTVCARVCHRNHDVTYAKYGNFFCDCGAKENGSCQALVKRSPQSQVENLPGQVSASATTGNMGMELTSSLRRRPSSPTLPDKAGESRSLPRDKHRITNLSKQLDAFSEQLASMIWKEGSMVKELLELLQCLMPAVQTACTRQSPVGCYHRAQQALNQLHTEDKRFVNTDQLMVPTLGSQEGAFENVRMNYTGDQGQTIRQLLSAHMIRRVAMCCLASPFGKRQHLAVSHEKGKITVLQLSALLKQADSSKRKLTLTRLASAPIPFTVLSLSGNPWNEDFLAVCGLKDCHVLTFHQCGSVAEHLVLHPQLETGNFIIRAIWLPGSQTTLALVTADFVKIYDLAKDVLSPQYYFLVPTGKIRDVTFICPQDEKSTMLVMSSAGYIYSQDMDDDSSAKHGPFYVTNTMEMTHPEIKDVSGNVCAGGVSIYYSHTLCLLFFSFTQGKSFLAAVKNKETLSNVVQIQLSRPPAVGNKPNNTNTTPQPQPLCQWSEVPNHPGLVVSLMQASNYPVILMVKPDCVMVQEIKSIPAKAKIMDMVAIRHPSSNSDHRTTLILLCEDGSLRIYMAAMDQTGFWLSPTIQAVSTMSSLKPSKKKKVPKGNKLPGTVTFPVDFFEHSTLLNDVEFGGNDLLQIYNASQIKIRLNTTGMYVASTKSTGFNIEITNNDATHVITGIRVLLGNQDAQRVPGYIEVFGRSTQTTVARNRWFDMPLTREESLQADKKLTVTFGPSQDPDGVIMVDSIKVYAKTKDSFGWPEETEEVTSNTVVPTPATTESTDSVSNFPPPITSLDKVVCGILEVLDSTILLMSGDKTHTLPVSSLTSLVSSLLILPTPSCVQRQVKSVLAALHPTRQSYHNYKDQTLLTYICKTLTQLKQVEDTKDLDAEAFYRLVLMTRAIAISRPQNLIKNISYDIISDSPGKVQENSKELLYQLNDILWRLHAVRPSNIALASVCVPGLTHVEAAVHCFVEVIHAFTVVDSSESTVSLAVKLYLNLLLSTDTTVSFAAKQAFIRVLRPRLKRRRVFIPSPPHCSTPGHLGTAEAEKPGPVSQPSQESSEADQPHGFEVDAVEPMVLLAPDGGAASGMNMEVLLGAGGFPPPLDIPLDADDETMVELAIALSLQEHEGGANLQSITQGLANLHNLAGPLQVLAQTAAPGASGSQEAGHFSDTTASAGASDDEGSTAATDGSTLRTSPAEQGGSESGGSGVDSITGEPNYSMSGRSSAYGDNIQENLVGARSETSSLGAPAGFQNQEPDGVEPEAEVDNEGGTKLHDLRLSILEKLIQFVPKLNDVGGMRSIPFMQVVLMLTSDLDANEERDRACLENLLTAVIGELWMKQTDFTDVCVRTPQCEVQLVIMRLISVLMSRSKSSSKTNSDNSCYISQMTATMLQQAGVIDFCLQLLKHILSYWKASGNEEAGTSIGGVLLKPHLNTPPPDMSPFFLKQYVKGQGNNVFKDYPQLLTEMALRLPYQVQKHSFTPITFDQNWFHYLCEYMMTQQAPFIRRHVRKLLLFICGTKEKYRLYRDLHSLNSNIKDVRQSCDNGGFSMGGNPPFTLTLSYDSLVELIEHLKACVEVASSRTVNWQTFCLRYETTLSFLLQVSCLLDEVVAQTILQLLQCAICPPTSQNTQNDKSSKNSSSKGDKDKDKDREKEKEKEGESEEVNNCSALVKQLNKCVERELLTRFIRTFLLDTNATNIRWQAHALVVAIYKNSDKGEQETVLDLMWSLWPQLPAYGRKAVQFVDLLGYFSIKCTGASVKMNEYIEQAVSVLHTQNQLLSHHPNANLYTHLAQYVELDGFYLESEPCLVCNNPEVPFSSIKLSTIKIDSKFTTTTQIVKLVGSHTISKITLRIGDLKKTKMVRTINIYYNNRTVQAVVELKNKPAMWHKAKKVSLVSGQTEVKMEFPLPIVACNLMIEYADFYENLQASSESLQCPRCSSSVPANPGVCANCGENVFQCHKCRAINYDEKDPFLCHACGFCKYAKFDYTLTGRPCCAVDPIENDEDRKKAITTINSHLEKADRVYKQLVGNKPTLEMLLVKISEHRLERNSEDSNNQPTNSTAVVNQVNRAIQLLAQRYCGDCKNSFDELSRIIQKVHACRRELVVYDRLQLEQSRGGRSGSTAGLASCSRLGSESGNSGSTHAGRCYGCASAATEHCLTLLRALAVTPSSRKLLCAQGLIQELVEFNLRKGTVQVQDEVRQLLCMVTRDNPEATEALCSLIMERISVTMRGHASVDLGYSVRPEIALLAALIQKEDSCWELKLRSVMQLFLMASKDNKSPVVMESVLLPCLKILQSLIKPDQPGSKKNKDKTLDALATLRPTEGVHIDRTKWLERDPNHTFEAWRRKMYSKEAEVPPAKPVTKEEVRCHYLMEKYAKRWRERTISPMQPLRLTDSAWLKSVLFNSSSRLARQVACNMLESICQVPVRKKEMLDLLTGFLAELGVAGESAAEFLSLYQSLVQQSPWKQYLAVKGVLMYLADLVTREIQELHRLEETTLTSDLAQGYALKMLTELMASFLEQDSIKQLYKGRLVGAVLNGYLSLRRLVVQRTRLIDDTQEKLLELLEEMTTGTEAETKAFMAICIETVEKCSANDVRTPVFVFERLCSIIYPEENDVGEFYLTLEKDPQQEDFLQGRMLGNPYSSNEPGLGPLMRDVKNKICQDCELVALLEDDNGMELLVNNKIISLDLPVREVYKKVWVAEGGEGDVMRVVYRMRGLLGDATEEFVETLTAKSEQEVDNEEVYKMANVMADCDGLQVMLKRLASIGEVNRSRSLLQVLLKLLCLCAKVKRNVEVLVRPELATISTLLNILQLCLTDPSHTTVTQQILDVMETVLSKASTLSSEEFSRFSTTLGGPEHIRTLLEMTETCASVRSNASLVHHLTTVLAALTYGSRDKMAVLIDHFRPYPLDFNRFDLEHNPDIEQKMELFCNLTAGIDHTPLGNTLKDHIVSLGIVEKALEYVSMHAPSVKPTLVKEHSEEWKEYISKPSLKYILRLLTGLATQHEATQLAVSADCIPIIHRLEQVSSDEHVGSLAENLLEALKTNPEVATRIEEVRKQTRAEKKRLAMAMREKQLGALGMRTNDKGQVTAESNMMQQLEELGEETGLVCVICREGYKFQPGKVLGIYTYTKRCNVDEFESKTRKTVGYSTVTHFNVVHVDCHMNAVRLARARDEWESAALQNANTRCNGLLPLWGPQVPESAFASCLARHNTYLQECTGHRDISYMSTVHDLKLLLLRFAQEKSFHEDAGGGGPQSNMHLIPYLLHMALYVINTTRCGGREEKNLASYLECASGERWLESSYESEGPLYWATLSLCLHSPGRWQVTRLSHLRRLLTLAHAHHTNPSPHPPHKITNSTPADYAIYKSTLVFFGLIDIIYKQYFKGITVSHEELWPTGLADYIRHNDETLLKCSEKLMAAYTEELLPCASFDEFCDVLGLLTEISDPSSYIKDILTGLVSP